MMVNLNLVLLSILKEIFRFRSLFLKEENKNEITETKKCLRCLRRVETFYNSCPYCTSTEFSVD
jgi:hypothetical protein